MTQTKERVYCREIATESSMLGTCEQVDVWLFLEYKPSWPARAIEEGALTPQTKLWLETLQADFAAQGLVLRPQLVRRPELDSTRTRLMLSGQGQFLEYDGVGYDFLQDLQPLADMSAASAAASLPQYFVCTNGKRDLCCARYGLPIYQRLRELVGDRVWQVNHLGGHRFAPNVLVAPQNVLYGRLELETVDQFVQFAEAREIDFAHLRGRSQYSKVVQAAEGLLGQQNLALLHVNGDAGTPGDIARVEFASADSRLAVSVQRAEQPVAIMGSCADASTKPHFPFAEAAKVN